ncbi:FHA domain-containing protein [Blastopirellula marina]|uniref:FHA domain-containing protein n=1 Tax=Blastopirellula marina TaxID=124 RepID=A0A2S8GRN2_9BACT|nr:FHA domain-containing protein [Blastopirellula marina]PQO47085.1 hypothetical protein C5Y93_06220 [Blastopirellula marina]
MRAYFTVQQGPATGRNFTAEQGSMFRIGRQATADIPIQDDLAMSGLHLAVICDKGCCRVRDLDSTNGTFVNGIRVNLVDLHDKDTIHAGNTELQVRLEGELNSTIIDPLVYPEIQQLRKNFNPQVEKVDVALEQKPSPERQRSAELDATASLSKLEIPPDSSADTGTDRSAQPDQKVHRLNITFEDATGKRQIWLTPGQTVIVGRNQLTDVAVIGDASISGIHFGLDCEDSACRLRDLQSQNGVWLNGVSVPHATIYSGDKFLAGKTEFQVIIDGGPTAPDAPLRTWVFEELVQRKFATFHASEVGQDHHLVDAVGLEPTPIELLRRLARHRDIWVVVDSTCVDIADWQIAARSVIPCSPLPLVVFHLGDLEKVVESVSQHWGLGAMAFVFPHEGKEEQSASIAHSIADYATETDTTAGSIPQWIAWLCHIPERITETIPLCEAVLVQHPDPRRWRILCETNFISRLNRLGYLPSSPSVILDEPTDADQDPA